MTDKELTHKLEKLGYTSSWLDFGILTIEQLNVQEYAYQNSDDQNPEHYRYSTFSHYLSSKSYLSDSEFDNYLQLSITDPDSLMAGSAAIALFNKIDLSDTQFEKLCGTIGIFGEWTKKVITREALLRKLRTTMLTDDLFKEGIDNGDSVIHEYLLKTADLNQLKELSVNGKNKSIRNVATEKYNRLKSQVGR